MIKPVLQSAVLLGAIVMSACDEDIRPAKEITVPIEIVGTSPIIEIHVNGEPVSVHFDLGNCPRCHYIRRWSIGHPIRRIDIMGADSSGLDLPLCRDSRYVDYSFL